MFTSAKVLAIKPTHVEVRGMTFFGPGRTRKRFWHEEKGEDAAGGGLRSKAVSCFGSGRPVRCASSGEKYASTSHKTQERLSCSCVDEVVEELVQRVLSHHAKSNSRRLMIGIAGPPGAGKSTLTEGVCDRLNTSYQTDQPEYIGDRFAAIVPMDGFHHTTSLLDAMPNPEASRARQGAPWTFDVLAFGKALRDVRTVGEQSRVYLPSFDHGIGNPVKNEICIFESTRIVLVEGNYILLDLEPWDQLLDLFDETWFLGCPLEVTNERVLQRHLDLGLSEKEALKQVEMNDSRNAQLVNQSMARADIIVDMNIAYC